MSAAEHIGEGFAAYGVVRMMISLLLPFGVPPCVNIYIGEVVDGSRMWCEAQEELTEVKVKIRSKTFSVRSNLQDVQVSHGWPHEMHTMNCE